MKKTAALLLALLLLLTALSCSKNDPVGTTAADSPSASPAPSGEETAEPVDPDELVRGLCDKYGLTEGFIFTSKSTELGEYLDEDLIQSYYGDVTDKPDFSKVSEYCLYVDESDPDIIIDVGVFRLADPAYADTLMKYLQARIDVKIENGARYTNIDVATLKKSVVSKAGDCVFYVVSYDTADIAADIRAALGK
jgi:hypothetical protein